MSPSAIQFSEELRRSLQKGDILIRKFSDGYGNSHKEYYEIVDPSVKGARFPKDTFLGKIVRKFPQFAKECVMVRELTPYGPMEKTKLFPKESDIWYDITRSENRTEIPSLKER